MTTTMRELPPVTGPSVGMHGYYRMSFDEMRAFDTWAAGVAGIDIDELGKYAIVRVDAAVDDGLVVTLYREIFVNDERDLAGFHIEYAAEVHRVDRAHARAA